MSTAFQSVANGIVAALLAAPALAGGRVFANRMRPLPAGQSDAIVVRTEQSAARETVLGALDWGSQFVVECYARGSTGGDPAAAVDALLGDTWARLAGLNASALGAMAINVHAAIEWQYDEADTPVVCAAVRLLVQHRTPVATLNPWS